MSFIFITLSIDLARLEYPANDSLPTVLVGSIGHFGPGKSDYNLVDEDGSVSPAVSILSSYAFDNINHT